MTITIANGQNDLSVDGHEDLIVDDSKFCAGCVTAAGQAESRANFAFVVFLVEAFKTCGTQCDVSSTVSASLDGAFSASTGG